MVPMKIKDSKWWKVITAIHYRHEPPFCYFTDSELIDLASETLHKPGNMELLHQRLEGDPDAQAEIDRVINPEKPN
jgi:hypothetical protein